MPRYLNTKQLVRKQNKPIVYNLLYAADTLPQT